MDKKRDFRNTSSHSIDYAKVGTCEMSNKVRKQYTRLNFISLYYIFAKDVLIYIKF